MKVSQLHHKIAWDLIDKHRLLFQATAARTGLATEIAEELQRAFDQGFRAGGGRSELT